jgi:hemerythrin superfamily protein
VTSHPRRPWRSITMEKKVFSSRLTFGHILQDQNFLFPAHAEMRVEKLYQKKQVPRASPIFQCAENDSVKSSPLLLPPFRW